MLGVPLGKGELLKSGSEIPDSQRDPRLRFLGGPLGSAEEFIRGVLGFIRGIWFSVTA
jgi:hypothetical protein